MLSTLLCLYCHWYHWCECHPALRRRYNHSFGRTKYRHRAKYTVDTSEDELGRTLHPRPLLTAGSSRIRSQVCANPVCASHRGVIIPSNGRRTKYRKAVTETVVTGGSCGKDREGHKEHSYRLSSAAISSGSTFTRSYIHVLPDRLCVIVRFPHFIMSACLASICILFRSFPSTLPILKDVPFPAMGFYRVHPHLRRMHHVI